MDMKKNNLLVYLSCLLVILTTLACIITTPFGDLNFGGEEQAAAAETHSPGMVLTEEAVQTKEPPLPTEAPEMTMPPLFNGSITPNNIDQTYAAQQTVVYEGYSIFWTADGERIVMTTTPFLPGSITTYDADTLEVLYSIPIAEGTRLMDFTSDGYIVMLTNDYLTIDFISTQDGTLINSFTPRYEVSYATFSDDDTQVAVAVYDTWMVEIYDAASLNLLFSSTDFNTDISPQDFEYYAYLFNDINLLVWTVDDIIQLQDPVSGEVLGLLENDDFIANVALSPDGSLLIANNANYDTGVYEMLAWNLPNQVTVGINQANEPYTSFAFSPDGGLLVSSSYNELLFWDVDDLSSTVDSFSPSSSRIYSFAFAPDWSAFAVLTEDSYLTLWRLAP